MPRKGRQPPRSSTRTAKAPVAAPQPSPPGTNLAAETAYISRFFVTQCPTTLGYVARLRGLAAPRPTDPFTYCDLGCGAGLTVNVLAAAMPQARFYGIDLSLGHIEAARKMAEAGNLANATFIQGGFEHLAARDDLPAFDFVTLQGVYSWVDGTARRHILAAAERLLKPDGLLYVSYNALPGWAPFLPVREALRVLVGQASGAPGERAAEAFRRIRYIAEHTPYFKNNPQARKLLDEAGGERRGYVIHEFLAGAWNLFTFDQVAADMASIGLEYCGSALLGPNAGDAGLAPELQLVAKAIGDPVAAEAIRSFLRSERYRADIFSTGRTREGWLGRWEDFAGEIFGPPAGPVPQPKLRDGDLAAPTRDFLEATATGRVTLAEIAATAPFAGITKETLLHIAHSTVRALARRPYARHALDDVASPDRIRLSLPIHRSLLAMIEAEGRAALPSPVLGTGISLSFATALVLDAACRVGVGAALGAAVERLVESGGTWLHEGKRLKTAEEIRPAMARQHEEFQRDWLPFLLRAGVVEPA